MKSVFSLSTFFIVGSVHMPFFLIASSHLEDLSKIVRSVQIYKGFFTLGMCCPFLYYYCYLCISEYVSEQEETIGWKYRQL